MKDILCYVSVPFFEYEHAVRDTRFSINFTHYHPEYEIYYLEEGNRTYYIDGHLYSVERGDLVVISSNVVHATLATREDYHSRHLIYIKQELFERNNRLFRELDIEELFRSGNGVYHLNERQQGNMIRLYRQIKEEATKKNCYYKDMIYGISIEIMLETARIIIDSKGRKPIDIKDTMEKTAISIAKYIDDNYSTINGIDSISETFYVSKFHMCRVFKQVTGITINEYIISSKINEATRLLEGTKDSVSDISEKVGFHSISSFEKTFKKVYGTTPSQYRKKILTLDS